MFAYADRRPDSAFGRALHSTGREIQRLVSTREPSAEQLDVGRAALAEILRAEAASQESAGSAQGAEETAQSGD
jgi:uncharacterized protein YqhQ